MSLPARGQVGWTRLPAVCWWTDSWWLALELIRATETTLPDYWSPGTFLAMSSKIQANTYKG